MKHMTQFVLYRMLSVLILAGLLLAACAPAGGAAVNTPTAPGVAETPTVSPTGTPAATPQGGKGQPELSPAVQAAITDLATRTGIDAGQVSVVEVEPVQWTDSCLGLGGPAESCLQVITEGYRIVLDAGGQQYEFHTDQEGANIRMADPTVGGLPEGDQPGAALSARQVLAQQLRVDLDQVTFISVEAVDWRDGCLEIQEPGVMCTQAIVPGYRVILEAGGKQYEFRTDQEGGLVKLARAPLPDMTGVVLVWEQTEGTACSRAEISGENITFGVCGETLMQAPLPPVRVEELGYFVTNFGSFTQGTRAGTVTFTGQGQQQATEAEQRSLAEWARLMFQEAQGGRSGASWGLAFAWHREGGIAGFCDDMGVYLTGWAFPSSCKGGQLHSQPAYRLTTDELAQMYAWVDQLRGFEYEAKDAAAADSMKVRMVFSGAGSEQVTPAQQEQIASFAARLYADAS